MFYQLVSADTQIICFDDVKKYFEFERLFSVVTEGLTLEKKNKDAIKIPFKKFQRFVLQPTTPSEVAVIVLPEKMGTGAVSTL